VYGELVNAKLHGHAWVRSKCATTYNGEISTTLSLNGRYRQYGKIKFKRKNCVREFLATL
jgi:hypothetical protein